MEIIKKQTLSETFSIYLDQTNVKNSFTGNYKWISLGAYWK